MAPLHRALSPHGLGLWALQGMAWPGPPESPDATERLVDLLEDLHAQFKLMLLSTFGFWGVFSPIYSTLHHLCGATAKVEGEAALLN